MELSRKLMKNAHIVTISIHVLIAILIIIFTAIDQPIGTYILSSVLLLMSLLALWPIITVRYHCRIEGVSEHGTTITTIT